MSVLWSLDSVRLGTLLVSVQDRCMVCAKCTIGTETILDASMVLQVTRLKCKLVLVYLEIVLILTQDRCTVCAKHTISSKITSDAPNCTLR